MNRSATWALMVLAVAYAFLAGFHSVQDFDLGWQLATGRWILQHHQIPSTDVLSYTAAGLPWIYPALSQVTLYLVYWLGGFALLTWAGAAASVATTALLLRRNRLVTCGLALVAVPLIANRSQPRTEMFTTALFAAFLVILWRQRRGQSTRLWLLPVLMIAWVNLHLGFVAGLALCVAYLGVEALDALTGSERERAVTRMRRAWPWMAATLAATLVNPWGVKIFAALLRQQQAQALHSYWLVEWGGIRPSWNSLHQALAVGDPQSSFWWLLAVAAVAIVAAAWRRDWGTGLLLATAAYIALKAVRFEALFAIVLVVVGGGVVENVWDDWTKSDWTTDDWTRRGSKLGRRWSGPLVATGVVVVVLCAALFCERSYDLISNRYYMRSSQLATFGAGASWWIPQRAFDFIAEQRLPGELFHDYDMGGYVAFRLGPQYRDYIDGRAIPFGQEQFFRTYSLSNAAPESKLWRKEEEARGIHTIVVSLARYSGIDFFPHLSAFCKSQTWRVAYLDEVSAVFVLRTAETAALLDRASLDCASVSFRPSQPEGRESSAAARARMFNFHANAAGVFYALGRYDEAMREADAAQGIFPDNARVHLTRALVLQELGRNPEAEAEFRNSLGLEPSDQAAFDLGLFYLTQKRPGEAREIFRSGAESSPRPHEMWMMLGQSELQLRKPTEALLAFDNALQSSPFGIGGETLGANFLALVATGQARAEYQSGDLGQAISFQEEAVRLTPEDAKLWAGLADLYDAGGRREDAANARQQAKSAERGN